jgi:hypothetical protein
MFSYNVFKNQFVDGICVGDITKGLIYKKFQNWKGHTHVRTLVFFNAIIQFVLDLIIEVMLSIMKKNLSTCVAMIQGTVERDYEHEVFY